MFYHYNIIVCSGRFPYPGPASSDNAVWMMANPNWGTINLHLGEVRKCLLQSPKL